MVAWPEIIMMDDKWSCDNGERYEWWMNEELTCDCPEQWIWRYGAVNSLHMYNQYLCYEMYFKSIRFTFKILEIYWKSIAALIHISSYVWADNIILALLLLLYM